MFRRTTKNWIFATLFVATSIATASGQSGFDTGWQAHGTKTAGNSSKWTVHVEGQSTSAKFPEPSRPLSAPAQLQSEQPADHWVQAKITTFSTANLPPLPNDSFQATPEYSSVSSETSIPATPSVVPQSVNTVGGPSLAPISQPSADQASANQPSVNQASVNQASVNQPSVHVEPAVLEVPETEQSRGPEDTNDSPIQQVVYDFGITPPAPVNSAPPLAPTPPATSKSDFAFDEIKRTDFASGDHQSVEPWEGRLEDYPYRDQIDPVSFDENNYGEIGCCDIPPEELFADRCCGPYQNGPGCHDDLGLCGTRRDGWFQPWISFGVRTSNRRTLGDIDFVLPIWQDVNSIFFLNLRGQFDDMDADRGNFGLAYRTFLKPNLILGTYLYYDSLTSSQDNHFNQGTFGVELLTLNWDFRVNGYFRETDARMSPIESGISNGNIVTSGFQERAYAGVDFEFGRRFLYWGWNDRYQFHWFLGGYAFDHDAPGFRSFGGPRSRIEFRVHDLGFFGQQSRLELGVESAYDRFNDGRIGAFLRLRIPLGARGHRDRIDPMRRRLVDRVLHEVD